MDVAPITPQQFADADGVGDWRVLYWGAHAFFRAASWEAGARFVGSIAALEIVRRHEPDVDLRHEGVAVKLITRDIRNLSTRDLEVARAISAVAREQGLVADVAALQVVQTAIASPESAEVTPFWRAVLGYVPPNDTHLVDPLRRGSSVFLQPTDTVASGRGRMHVDVCVPHDEVHARIAAALAAGGRMVDDSFAPEWWTLADAENHKVDVTTWWGRESVRLEEQRAAN
ncbi:VOC family protein [Agromyces aurantiacus]|uniref:Putative pterin-4-alpha-carbinolamine dehydratase n=1 Tax=Agromyces aurantiacus TaxID=165814 RepID=A0ABV9R0K6_9MICO|nr:VOC family protein [Agromyces aurantiacus]MBM7505952.1 4a-hydroxytetrahydrobiopterin dehydratase [Agromyces aurantiacus]